MESRRLTALPAEMTVLVRAAAGMNDQYGIGAHRRFIPVQQQDGQEEPVELDLAQPTSLRPVSSHWSFPILESIVTMRLNQWWRGSLCRW